MKPFGGLFPAPLQAVDRVVRRGEWSALRPWSPGSLWRPKVAEGAPIRFLMGPANFAEQGYLWSRAVEQVDSKACGVAMRLGEDTYKFRKDYSVATRTSQDLLWALRQMRWVPETFTHVFIEACRPVLDPRLGLLSTVSFLERAGVGVGLVLHGSEVRLPSLHAQMYEFSPFRFVPGDRREWVAALEHRVKRNLSFLAELGNPKYVATPDLIDFVPGASWNPNCVNPPEWDTAPTTLECSVPKVVFAPTNGWLKGAALIEQVLTDLDHDGRIRYTRAAGLPHEEAACLIKECDIVIDSMGIGYYATTSIQAMAAGRLVICLVDPRVRKHVPDQIPVVMPEQPALLKETIIQVLQDRSAAQDLAARGPDFVARWHDGRQSGTVLAGLWQGQSSEGS